MLDFQSYLFLLARQNRLAKQLGFHPCLCSGMAGLEGVLESFGLPAKGEFDPTALRRLLHHARLHRLHPRTL